MMASKVNDFDAEAALTLKEACTIFFRDKIGPKTLRSLHRQGRLSIMRIGKSDFVTAHAMREMMKCQENSNPQESSSSRALGSSETDRTLSAQAAAKAIAQELKKRSVSTSAKSSGPQSASIIPLRRGSPDRLRPRICTNYQR